MTSLSVAQDADHAGLLRLGLRLTVRLAWPDDFLWCWKFSRKQGTFGWAAKKDDQLIRATPTRPGGELLAKMAPMA